MIPLEFMYLLMMCIAGKCSIQLRIFFEEDSNTIWIASLDNHMYHDLSSNTIENTMIPQDYTGIVR